MPLFDFLCPQCGEITDIWAGIEEYRKNCPMCGKEMDRLISAPHLLCDLEPYFDANLADSTDVHGKWVESRQHKRQLLKEQELVEIG